LLRLWARSASACAYTLLQPKKASEVISRGRAANGRSNQ
jgi:hypothetical protein